MLGDFLMTMSIIDLVLDSNNNYRIMRLAKPKSTKLGRQKIQNFLGNKKRIAHSKE